MTRLPLIVIFFALVLASPAAFGRHPRTIAALKPDEPAQCLRLASRDEVLAGALLSGALGGKDRSLRAVRLSGTRSLPDAALWELIGGPPAVPLSGEEAIVVVARLAQTGLFSAVEPRIEGEELEIALTQNPQVRSVEVHGLSEFRTEDIVDRLLEAPSAHDVSRRLRQLAAATTGDCLAPLPPRAWLARVEDGEVRGGVLWQGLRTSLGRVMHYLRSRGYPLARLKGELTAAGELRVEIDEGHVGAVEVRGLDGNFAREVEEELGIQRGDVFSGGELTSALERVQRRWPFVRAGRRSRRSLPAAVLKVEGRLDGATEFRSELPSDAKPPPDGDEDDDSGDDTVRDRVPRWFPRSAWGAWYGFEGDRVIVYLKTEQSRMKVQWTELLRHTPVTGFAPGLAATLTFYDRGDRAHLMLDGAVNINTRRPALDATSGTFLERLNAQQRTDWLAGPRLRIPALGIAELGGQIHALTDTADSWRISKIDSYVYSALLNRADREYYRRSGFAAFVTLHLDQMLTLGAEYRRDRYGALDVPRGVWSVFNSGDVRYGAAPVDEGEMGSALFRLEYQSERTPLHQVGSMWRSAETSLVGPEPGTAGLRTMNTFEVADRSLGGTFQFNRLVSDSSFTVETGRSETVTLRIRGAGGHDLPLQKQEGLGGWTALRGYDFKEFRGNASLLGTLQFEGRHFGGFLDVGSVHQAGAGWIDPKTAAGAMLIFENTRVEAAWRLDGRARLAPEFRILFAVPL